MPDFAKNVTINVHSRRTYVDGIEFPWWMKRESVSVAPSDIAPDLHEVTLTFFVESLTKRTAFDGVHEDRPATPAELNDALQDSYRLDMLTQDDGQSAA